MTACFTEIMTEQQMTPLARRFRAATVAEGRAPSPHTLRTIGGIIIRTATHGQEHCGDVYGGHLAGGVRYFGVEGDGGVYLEAWGHETPRKEMSGSAETLRRLGWDVAVGRVKDGVGIVVTAWHAVEPKEGK